MEPTETPVVPASKTKLKIALTAIITALVVGGGVYWWQSSDAATEKATLQDKVSLLNAKLAKPTATPTLSPTATPTTEDTIIVEAAVADAEANVGVTNAKGTISAKSGTNFARVSISLSPGGYAAVLKKVNGIWVVIITGQDAPSKDDAAKYGLPTGWY